MTWHDTAWLVVLAIPPPFDWINLFIERFTLSINLVQWFTDLSEAALSNSRRSQGQHRQHHRHPRHHPQAWDRSPSTGQGGSASGRCASRWTTYFDASGNVSRLYFLQTPPPAYLGNLTLLSLSLSRLMILFTPSRRPSFWLLRRVFVCLWALTRMNPLGEEKDKIGLPAERKR